MRAAALLDVERERLAVVRRTKGRHARYSDKYRPQVAQAIRRMLSRETLIRMAYGEMDDD